ncbi:MAG: nitroreductase family protein [Chloroflexota bacterium]|nr:nitroreductase family protein [Chloroflexota bacterium]
MSARDVVRPLIRVRQIREFTEQPVSGEELDALAEVARWTGSSRNSQPWRFVMIRNVETLRAIAAAGMPQTRSLRTAMAAIAIVMPGDSGMAISYAYDEARAAERILIGASMLGLGAAIAWVLAAVRPTVASLLHLPEDRTIRTVVAIGHPSDAARRPKSAPGQARRPLAELVFHERWPDANDR